VYVSSDDTLYAVDVATGTSAWQYALGGWPSIANGLLFVASKDGTLTAFTLAE
jgi:outer membrane protein assembly factor BamB